MGTSTARSILLTIMILCSIAKPFFGQEIDSAVTQGNRAVPSVASEIPDPAERAAFLALYQTHDPRTLRTLSCAFLQQYPRSAFLATVYELAARSSFDLGDFSAGLDYARQSLAILPENPLFLVAVADVEARANQQEAAIENAQDALNYLDRFARPIAIAESDWPHILRTQKATAWFVIGRVQLSQALAMPAGTAQRGLLDRAASSVSQARTLNPNDPEITYLLGLIDLASQKASEAAACFAEIYKRGGDFSSQARNQLQTIYTLQAPSNAAAKTTIGFDAFVRSAERNLPVATPVVVSKKPSVHLPGYAGSAACNDCHSDIYSEWKKTGMAKMLRPYQPQNVIGDFVKNNEFYAGDNIAFVNGKLQITPAANRKLFARMVIRNGHHYFEIKESGSQWHTYPVDYTIGSKWQQAYATTLPNGEIHVFPIQYNRIQKKWVNYWKVIDSPGTERSNPYNWEKLDNATNYRANCAMCHTSQLRSSDNNTRDPEHLIFREPGIDCEMCHGPGAAHIAAINKGKTDKIDPLSPPVQFDRIGNREFVNICAQCHMQSNLHTASPHGEMNYSSTGSFFLTNKSVPLNEFSRKAFYKDGRLNKTTFIVESLERSQCFRKGGISCGTCHDPHSGDAESNPTSLKFKDDPDRMCTSCHTQFLNKSNIVAHTHHPVQLEASRCVSCHMPWIMDGLLFEARSHQIDDIPNAEMTERFGQNESPNACLLCHTKRTAQWVQSSLQSWKTASSTKSMMKK